MKKLFLIMLMGFSSLVFSANASGLFFQTSSKASIAKLHKNNYMLTINSQTDHVSYYSGKTRKKSGVMPLEKFFSFWSNKENKYNFSDNPPNAVISMVSENDEKQQTIVAVVSNPGFARGVVSYQISVLDNKPVLLGNFKNIVLFFDDILWNPDGA